MTEFEILSHWVRLQKCQKLVYEVAWVHLETKTYTESTVSYSVNAHVNKEIKWIH